MARNDRNTNTRPQGPAAQERGAPPAGHQGQEEELSMSQAEVVSMGHVEEFTFSVEGDVYDAWMPRIARQADGLVPVLPCTRLSDGQECLLIVPGAFNSWLRKNQPRRGTKLTLRRKGVDEHTGAWKLSVVRL